MDAFVENFERLLGLHHLTAKQAARMTGITESTLSKWSSGKRSPSFESAITVGETFGIEPGRLAKARFEDLLAHELADPERYREVEKRIKLTPGNIAALPESDRRKVVVQMTPKPKEEGQRG